MAITTLSFSDQNGANPLPGGIGVAIVAGDSLPLGASLAYGESGFSLLNAGPDAPSIVASGFLAYGGSLTVDLDTSTIYMALFFGSLGPQSPCVFTTPASGSSQSVNVGNYQSPAWSATGFTQFQSRKWVRAAFGATARQVGGEAYTLAYGLNNGLAFLESFVQAIVQALRLPSSANSEIDSWFADFFGLTLPRFSGESDTTYTTRGETMLRARLGTVDGLETVAGFYATDGSVSLMEPFQPSQVGGTGSALLATGQATGGVGSRSPHPTIYLKGPLENGTDAQAMTMLLAARAAGIDLSALVVSDGVATPLSA